MDLDSDLPAAPETGRLSFATMPGWAGDDPEAALAVTRRNPVGAARAIFGCRFRPGDPVTAHLTGSCEPEFAAALATSADFPVPIHALPPDGIEVPRIEADSALAGQEIAWLRDEVGRFFLQVVGSGRLRLYDGTTLRVGYAGANGHPYRSIGKFLIARGAFGADITADALKSGSAPIPTVATPSCTKTPVTLCSARSICLTRAAR